MEKEVKKTKRVVYYDILNIISIIAVVAMHQNSIVHKNPMIRAWNTSLIVDCIFYFAVPVFCMLTGATLMNYREKYDTKTFFKKRFSKVLIPFLFWSSVMFIWKIFIIKTLKVNGVVELINDFFKYKHEYTYYFMFVILGLYLMMPLLSHFTEPKHRKTLWYIVALFFIINSGLVPILRLVKIEWNMDFSVLFGNYVFFVILGYLLSTEDIKKDYRILIYFGAIVGLVYRYAITFILSKRTGIVDKTCWGYETWNSILLAASVFLIVKKFFNNPSFINEKTAKALATISSCTFGVYLIHLIVKYYEIQLLNVNENSWIWRTVGIIPTYLISLGIVYIMKKIPVLKKLVP